MSGGFRLRLPRRDTIHGKLALLFTGAIVAAVAVVFLLILYQQQRLIRSEWMASLGAQARLVATNSQAALDFMDRREAERLLRAVESNASIRQVRLLVGDEGVFAEFVRPGMAAVSGLPQPPGGVGSHFGDGLLAVWTPVPGVDGARIELVASLEAMEQAVLRTALETGSALLVALFLFLWLSGRLARRLAAPVEDLRGLMARISANASLQERARVQGNDEIAQLGRGLNTMIDTLQARDQELARYRQDLERRVEERTQALSRATEEARQANNAKGDFLARMSHEIRTPMNAIVGLGKLLLKTPLDACQRDYQEKVLAASDALLGIINDVLDYSRIEAGRLALESIPLELDQVVRSVASQVALRAEEKGLELLFLVDADVPRRLTGDPLRLGQVLVNLVSNAIKFTEQGEVLVRVEALAPAADGRVRLGFSVRDTGMGIPRERQGELFSPFTQVDESITRRFGGSGLGLSICKQLVEMMDGEIALESQSGQGSTFRFSACFGLPDALSEPLPPAAALAGQRVLVIDDSPGARQVLAAQLAGFGLRPETAAGGEAGLEALVRAAGAGDPFRLVLLDWPMTDPDGLETARRIRATAGLEAAALVLMATPGSQPQLAGPMAAAGLRHLLAKPWNEAALLAVLLEAAGAPVQAGGPAHQPVQAGPALQGARVLLVDDVELNRIVAQAFLRQAGVEVDVAVHGREALERIAATRYDLVLMDIQMPEMDGLAATRALRREPRHRDLPIIAMTAHAMDGDRELSLAAGMQDHLTKPIDPDALFAVLARWIEPRAEPVPAPEPASGAGAPADPELPRLEGVDTARGLALHRGRPELYRRVLASFARDFRDAAGGMDRALQAEDFILARRLAHSLKSAAASIGAADLAHRARAVEACHAAGQRAPQADYDALARELHRIWVQLEPLAAGTGIPAGAAGVETDAALALLDRLEALLRADDAGAMRLLEALESACAGARPGPLARLRELVEDVEYDAALQVLPSLRDWLQGRER